MKSAVFHFRGLKSEYQHTFQPSLFNEQGGGDAPRALSVAVTHFSTHFSGCNVTPDCCTFKIGKKPVVHLAPGNYDVLELSTILHEKSGGKLSITPMYAQRRLNIRCNEEVDLTAGNSIAPLLGVSRKRFKPHVDHQSEECVSIHPITALNIGVEGALGMYRQGARTCHVHHQEVHVPPHFKIIYAPQHPVFYPLVTTNLTHLKVFVCGEDHVTNSDVSLESWGSQFNLVVQVRAN
jgi:hypothetical protein